MTLIHLAWAGLSLALGSCGSEAVQQQLPSLESDLGADLGDADFIVDFGTVLLGDTATRRFRLVNGGNAALAIEIDRPSAPFSADLPRTLSSIDIGGGVDVRVTFAPLEERDAPFEQILEIATNEGKGRTYRLRLRGRGVRGVLNCEPSSIDFGAVLLGSASVLRASCTNPLPLGVEATLRILPGNHAGYFTATGAGAEAGVVRIAAGEAVEFEVEFRAQSQGINTATLEIRDHVQQPIGRLPLQGHAVSSRVLVEPASCLDFSYVNLGSRATRELTLVNVGGEDVNISRIDVPEIQADEFSSLTETPLHLEAEGGRGSVEIAFQPQRSGSREFSLQIWTSDGQDPISVCVKGFGGGPHLACNPTSHDLGSVGIGLPAAAIFTCSNIGAAPEGSVIDPLVVRSISVDHQAFTPTIRNPDGTIGPRSRGYRLGEHFQLEVAYDPIAELFDEALVLVQTNVNEVGIQIAGQGRDVAPCEFSINPPWLRFGVLPRGETRTLELEIENFGDTACIVRDLRLSHDTTPGFSMEAIQVTEIEAKGTLRVPVTFAPRQQGGSFGGKLLFDISNPSAREQEVRLTGASLSPCLLIEPQDLDFGAVAPGCQPNEQKVTLSNICGSPLEIASLELSSSPGEENIFSLQPPATPLQLKSQDYTEVVVAFAPDDLGEKHGTLVVSLAGSAAVEDHAYLAALRGEGSQQLRQTDDFTSTGIVKRPTMDILWVIDNSTSMAPYQDALKGNLPAFLTAAASENIDFQIGVTTSALRYGGSCPGGANGGEDGRLFPVDGSHPRILTPSTPNLETHWRHNVAVGNCFDFFAESPLEAARRALSPPLINQEKDSRYSSPYQDGNAGFLRPNAALSVILVSDAQDYSPYEHAVYVDFFHKLKRGRTELVRVHAISGPRIYSSEPGCITQPGDRMIDMVEATGGTWLSICTPTSDTAAWRIGLEDMSKGVFDLSRRLALRGVPADVNRDGKVDERDIEVRVDGKVEPPTREDSKVWTYHPLTNEISFEAGFNPRSGTPITASYDLRCG